MSTNTEGVYEKYTKGEIERIDKKIRNINESIDAVTVRLYKLENQPLFQIGDRVISVKDKNNRNLSISGIIIMSSDFFIWNRTECYL